MRPSKTAQFAAAHRACHFIRDRPAIFEDTAAIWLLAPPLSTILRVAPLRCLFWRPLVAKIRPISAFIAVRSRYVEDMLEHFMREDCRQYVILGAGLDSWALRHEVPGITVFEVDHPTTQQWKESRIRSRLGALPSHLVLVPVDLSASPQPMCYRAMDSTPEPRHSCPGSERFIILREGRLKRRLHPWRGFVRRAAE